MGTNEFIGKFAEIFDDTDASILSPETKFRKLDEWSSLSALGVIALADEEFDIELSGAEMRQVNTIQELYNLPQEKFFINMENIGNTVSNSIPIVLYDTQKQELLHGPILICGFGVGYSWGECILKTTC